MRSIFCLSFLVFGCVGSVNEEIDDEIVNRKEITDGEILEEGLSDLPAVLEVKHSEADLNFQERRKKLWQEIDPAVDMCEEKAIKERKVCLEATDEHGDEDCMGSFEDRINACLYEYYNALNGLVEHCGLQLFHISPDIVPEEFEILPTQAYDAYAFGIDPCGINP